jgi:hypothetical protein
MKKSRFLTVIAILVIVLTAAIGVASSASAQTVCSPATALSVPVVKDTMGQFCWQTTTLCYQVNSWNTTTLSINGTSYKNMFVLASSIPPLNGGYTITFDGGNIPYAPGHIEITGPYQGGGTGPCNSTPVPTNTPTTGASPTRTNTPTIGVSPTRTRTATNGPSLTSTRTPTLVIPTWTPSPTLGTPTSICSPATTITAPFVGDGIGTFCWRISSLGFINSNNLDSLTVNGQNFTNLWANTAMLPPRQADGFWYIKRVGNFTWSHFEAQP